MIKCTSENTTNRKSASLHATNNLNVKSGFTLLDGLQLLVDQPQLLVLILQRKVLLAELNVLKGLHFGLLLQLHHFVHQELGQTLVTFFDCGVGTHIHIQYKLAYCLQRRVCLYMCVCLTYDGGEAPGGLLPCDQLVQLRVIELHALQKSHVAPLSFSVEDVK